MKTTAYDILDRIDTDTPSVADAEAALAAAKTALDRDSDRFAKAVREVERCQREFQSKRDDAHAEAIRLAQLEAAKADTFLGASRRDFEAAKAAKESADRAEAVRLESEYRAQSLLRREAWLRRANDIGTRAAALAQEYARLIADLDPALLSPDRLRAEMLVSFDARAVDAAHPFTRALAIPPPGGVAPLILALCGFNGHAEAYQMGPTRDLIPHALDGSLPTYLHNVFHAEDTFKADRGRLLRDAEIRRTRRAQLEKDIAEMLRHAAGVRNEHGESSDDYRRVMVQIERMRKELIEIRDADLASGFGPGVTGHYFDADGKPRGVAPGAVYSSEGGVLVP